MLYGCTAVSAVSASDAGNDRANANAPGRVSRRGCAPSARYNIYSNFTLEFAPRRNG